MAEARTTETVDVGLIGFGLAGRAFHAQVIHAVPGMRLAAILQRQGNEAAEAYPGAKVVRSLDELLALDNIKLIVIATPNETHFPLAKRCLEAGRDVVVDKPFTTSLDEAKELVRIAREHKRFLTVYQNRRYDGDFQTIANLLPTNVLGRVVRFESSYDRYRPLLKPNAWREQAVPGAGILFDIAPHLLDHAFTLFGIPEAIAADVRTEREGALADDAFDIFLHYPNELRAALQSSILAVTPRPRFLIFGTRGSYRKQSFDPTENNLRFGKIPESGPWGAEPEEDWGVLSVAGENGAVTERRLPNTVCDYRDFYANARDVILGKAQPLVTTDWALDIMRALELCRQSSLERRTIAWPGAFA